ncbi:MAG: PTS sugar transporter subunit IIC [Pelolinea sp.]|jgi:PTS system cellobiose-specific IIC component|nr:PTS sugar transporter subunit IIC [Pelolinea sp.]
MNKLFESKFMKGLQKFGEKLASSKVFSAISKSMMGTMAIILVGAVFQIIATIPTLFGWYTTESAIYKLLYTPYNMTMGILSVFVVFMIGYNYAKSLGMKPMQNGVVALICFLLVAAPATTVTVADGATSLTVLNTSNLGAAGLFVAILIGILTVNVTHFCEKKNIVIKMPDVVPSFLSEAFSAMLPLLFNIIIWYGISSVLSLLTGGQMTLPLLITYILSIPLSAINTIPGMFIAVLFACLLWTFGIHGSMVVFIALMAIMIQNISANAAAVAAGNQPQFYATMLTGAMACAGGTGNTLGLVLLGLKSAKSKQLKAVSKAAIVPGIFNINEPVTFGFPIMYNPIMAIPYILTPLITMLVLWLGYAIGFFKPAYVLIMSLLPLFMGEFLGSMAWQNLFIPIVGIVVGLIVYYPFFKVYDKQLVEKEAAAKTDEKA